LILLSLSCLALASCATPSVDKPDLGVAPKACPPSLQADLPPEPQPDPLASLVKPPPGSKAAAATQLWMDWTAAEVDWARLMLGRATAAKTYCDRQG